MMTRRITLGIATAILAIVLIGVVAFAASGQTGSPTGGPPKPETIGPSSTETT